MNAAQRVTYQQTDRGVVPVYADEVVSQPNEYTSDDDAVWNILRRRQEEMVQERAHPLFLEHLKAMEFGPNLPKFEDINKKLHGWEIVAVNGLLSDVAFFSLLAQKKFPVTWWIRKRNQIDYIQEPDLFHDLFGHVPMLRDPAYTEIFQKFGRLGSGPHSSDPAFMQAIARLYWFSVEFGMMKDQGTPKVLGAGILSSPGEIMHAMDANTPKAPFRHKEVAKTSYKIDSYQLKYFVLDDISHLKHELNKFEHAMDGFGK